MFYGEKLLTTGNPDVVRDQALFARLGLKAEGAVTPGLSGADAAENKLCGHHASGACASAAQGLSEHNVGVEA
jgi:biotin synthase